MWYKRVTSCCFALMCNFCCGSVSYFEVVCFILVERKNGCVLHKCSRVAACSHTLVCTLLNTKYPPTKTTTQARQCSQRVWEKHRGNTQHTPCVVVVSMYPRTYIFLCMYWVSLCIVKQNNNDMTTHCQYHTKQYSSRNQQQHTCTLYYTQRTGCCPSGHHVVLVMWIVTTCGL